MEIPPARRSCPSAWTFLAALRPLSLTEPQPEQLHSLIRSLQYTLWVQDQLQLTLLLNLILFPPSLWHWNTNIHNSSQKMCLYQTLSLITHKNPKHWTWSQKIVIVRLCSKYNRYGTLSSQVIDVNLLIFYIIAFVSWTSDAELQTHARPFVGWQNWDAIPLCLLWRYICVSHNQTWIFLSAR